MGTRYALLLRGVNVGGINLKMTEVAAAFTDAGFTRVRTILASGNVLVESELPADALRDRAQTVLRQRFGYEAWVLVYDLDTLRALTAAFPFEPQVDGYHSYVTFVADAAVLDELIERAADSGDKVARGDGVIYWQVLKHGTLDSPLGKAMGKARYKPSITTRNLRTLGKLISG